MAVPDTHQSASAAGKSPTIAVVICTRDRPRALLETLDSIWRQTRRPDELVIIDDGDLPEKIQDQLAGQCRELGIKWVYRRTTSPGLTPARNLATEATAGDVLQYLDDDVTCQPDFLAEIERVLRDPGVAGVTATVYEPRLTTPSARLYQLGYRLAGWWRIAPRCRPPGPRPAILNRPELVAPARYLSGAAMAVRRDLVRAWRFNEALTEYALGEDREFSYRLAPRHWFLRARKARVVHRREAAGRTNAGRLGFMTTHNYLWILDRTCRLGIGEWMLIGWSLLVLAAMHLAWALVGDRRMHLAELQGMAEGVAAFLGRRRGRQDQSGRTQRAALDGMVAPPPVIRSAPSWSPRPCRVLFVTTDLAPGGAELMLLSLITRLPHYHVQPLIASLKPAGALADQCRLHGTIVLENLLRFKTDAVVLWRLRRVLREQRIDVVVAAQSGGDRMFWGALAARMCNLPVVVWSHWFPRPRDRHFEWANRALYRWVDAFVALGHRHRRALSRHAFVPAGRIAVIPNGIELERFRDGPGREEVRRQLGLSEEDIAIALIANLRPEKRHDVFIEAARRLATRDSRYRFLIIGDGPSRELVRTAVAAADLPKEAIRLLGRREDVPELLRGLDICCLCSEVECFSVTMLEAAAAGCAFIGPEVGCLTDYLEHHSTGLAIRPADVPSLTDAIAELAMDAELRHRLAATAKQQVVRSYSIDKTARMFADLVFGLAHRAPRSPGRPRRRRTGATAAWT